MNKLLYKIKKQKGAASIFITMLILTGMLFVTLTANSIVQNGIVMSRAHLNSTKAYFAAESGTEKILFAIRQPGGGSPAINPFVDPNWDSGDCVRFNPGNGKIQDCDEDCVTGNHITEELDNHSYYKIKYTDLTGLAAKFSTTGVYEDITKRVVEVQYQF